MRLRRAIHESVHDLGVQLDVVLLRNPERTLAIWNKVDARQLLQGSPGCSRISVVFRLAYELPPVSKVVVGVSTAAHLAELVATSSFQVDNDRIAQYRSLLRAKALATEAS